MKELYRLIIGQPRDPMSKDTRRHIVLVAFLAWIGLGADGLSSSCYGPEQSFIALGSHYHLALYLAFTTAISVVIISLAYNQVIRLFPNGGGGYKVATQLLGPYAGLISGAALIIDYIMTIALSTAAGVDAIFSLLPRHFQPHKIHVEVVILLLLIVANLRGMKESIKILMPIFLGFFITHVVIILYGVFAHGAAMPHIVHDAILDTHAAAREFGMFVVVAFFLRAYSMGAGTYTGLEAVSNNVHMLAEPRVKTGRLTMVYMAISLSFTAGGIILLYLLWHVHPEGGKTLNAVAFENILGTSDWGKFAVTVLMLFEALLLFVGANTGFLGGPAVLANMSLDSWVPRRFGWLSSRLVTQNGIIFFGMCALIILLWARGSVELLVVLYSINVFITFSIAILGLCVYWWKHRAEQKHWLRQLSFSIFAFIICFFILMVMIIEKFHLGGWITLVVTGVAILICILIRRHYERFRLIKKKLDQQLQIPTQQVPTTPKTLNPAEPTAVFFVKDVGAAMHALLWVLRMFPGQFHNIIFVSHGIVDTGSFGSEKSLANLKSNTEAQLDYLVNFARMNGFAATALAEYGAEPVSDLSNTAEKILKQYPNSLFFGSRYVYPTDNWITRLLHSDIASLVQRRLYSVGAKMLIIPVNLEI